MKNEQRWAVARYGQPTCSNGSRTQRFQESCLLPGACHSVVPDDVCAAHRHGGPLAEGEVGCAVLMLPIGMLALLLRRLESTVSFLCELAETSKDEEHRRDDQQQSSPHTRNPR